MSRDSALQSILAKIDSLQRQAALLRAREKKPVLNAIAEAIHHYEITLPELRSAVGASKKRGGAAGGRGGQGLGGGSAHPLAGRVIPAKYKNPKGDETWSGRGSVPVWLRELESKGMKREAFLIKKAKR